MPRLQQQPLLVQPPRQLRRQLMPLILKQMQVTQLQLRHQVLHPQLLMQQTQVLPLLLLNQVVSLLPPH